MTYFKNCKTIEDVKNIFKNLAKKLHPDNGGNPEEFKNMMTEYKIMFDRLKNIHQSKEGETYEKKTTTETPEQFAAAINAVINFDDIEIELVGAWVWLNGNTYPYRDIIKEAGYFWSSKHKKWYYNGDQFKSKKHSKKKFEEIEDIYGAEILKKAKMPRIATA